MDNAEEAARFIEAELQRPMIEQLNQTEQPVSIDEAYENAIDAAMADIIIIADRHRARLGRQLCSPQDATIMRRMHELLTSMVSEGVENDPAFGYNHRSNGSGFGNGSVS